MSIINKVPNTEPFSRVNFKLNLLSNQYYCFLMVNTILAIIALLALIGVGLAVSNIPTISATSTNATSTNATSTNATSTNVSQQIVDQPHFKAELRGIQQFSPNTNASGEAYFRVLDDENIGYVVDVSNISGVSSAFIVYWDGVFPDKTIVPLRLASLEGIAAPGEVASGTAEGTFGVADFSERGPVDRSISDFVKHVLDGNVYLKITTVQTPLGEIAGKLVPQVQ
jgi:CHRD domain